MFSEATHEQKKESVEAPASAEAGFSDHEDEMMEEEDECVTYTRINSFESNGHTNMK